MSVAILIPVLRRPHRVRPLLESIREATPEPHRVVFLCTPKDNAERQAIEAARAELYREDSHELIEILMTSWPCGQGDYARKINLGYRHTTEPWILCGADDLLFHPGWLSAALRVGEDESIGVVGTQDLGNKRVLNKNHSTHPLVRRAYIERYGTIDEPKKVLHEGYFHNFCDTELVNTAKARHAWRFAEDSTIEHLHHWWGKAPCDEVYELGQKDFKLDSLKYRMREHLWLRLRLQSVRSAT